MAQRQLELSSERFRAEIDAEDDELIRATSLNDVRITIAQTERQLASRQSLRHFDRLSPYINAAERCGQVIEVFCNSSPMVSYIWGPVKLIILAIKEQTRALDHILDAYAQIGNALPRLSALQESLRNDRDFQLLFAFLYEDITEFHRRVYRLIRRKDWTIFFLSAWGRFERHFSALIANIAKTSDLIDKQATTYHILEVKEWRQKSLDDSIAREQRWATEQLEAVLNWLGADVYAQNLRLDWLHTRSHAGTSSWITNHSKFRSWLQRGRGNPVLWIYGKPGSGKSVLISQIVPFVSADPNKRALFFFCDYHTPAYAVSTQILKAFLTQCISQDPEIVPYLYDEYLAKRQQPVAQVLKQALMPVIKSMNYVRLIVDGVDEVQPIQQKLIIQELTQFTKLCGDTCKLLIASQDLPTIRRALRTAPYLFLGDEREAIEEDMRLVVDASLMELDESLDGALGEARRAVLQDLIVNKAEGMFLWVKLILDLLETSSSLNELNSNIDELPKDLEDMYKRLLDNIRGRCTPKDLLRVSRIFEWLLFAERKGHIRKHEVLLGSSIHEECTALDRDSKPFPSALDICKPLIEDGPGGTIALIHSTLPSFLLDSQSGPSISAQIAHEHIAFACVSHLLQILEFAQPEFRKEKMTENVGLGCFGLQGYASEHWTSHILKYIQLAHTELNSDSPLVTQLIRLSARHDALSTTITLSVKENAQGLASNLTKDTWLQNLGAFPRVCDLISRVHTFQKVFSDQQLLEGPGIQAIDWDTTLFSLADSNYQDVVKSLLQATTCTGLSSTELRDFQAEFAETAFPCPVKGCQRSWIGYASAAELDDHKNRRHSRRLRCYQGECVHNDVGFRNDSTLRQHVQKVHKKSVPRIPATLKRKRETEQPGSPPPSDSLPELPPTEALSKGPDNDSNTLPRPDDPPDDRGAPRKLMFRPEQMRNIPQLSPEEKVRYENGLRQLWTALHGATPGSPQQREAQKKIMDFSHQLVNKMKQRMPGNQVQQQNEQAGNDQNQGAANGAVQPQSQGQAQRPGSSSNIHIQQHLEAMTWIPPPEVINEGPETATKWSASNREKYTRAMLQMQSTTERLKSNESLAKTLRKKGASITLEEQKSLQNIDAQKPQIIKAYQDAKRFVEEFRKGQAERTASG